MSSPRLLLQTHNPGSTDMGMRSLLFAFAIFMQITGASLYAQGVTPPSTANPGTGEPIGRLAEAVATPEELADPPLGKIRKLDLDSVDRARKGLAEVLASVPVGPDGQSSPWFARLKAIKTQLDRAAASQEQTDLFASVPLLAEIFRPQDVPAFVNGAFGHLANLSVCFRETAAFHVKQRDANVADTTLAALVFRVGHGYTSEPDWEDRPPPIDAAGVMILDAPAVVAQLRAGPWEEAHMFLGGVDDAKSCFARYAPGGDGLVVLKTKYTQNRAMIDAQFVELKNWVAQQEAAALAYRKLAKATALPEASVDGAGKTLPKEFSAYLKDENSGHDRIIDGLSPDSASLDAQWRTVLGQGSVCETLWHVAGIAKNAEPSELDFITYTSVRMLVREYPSVIDQAQSVVAAPWKTLSESPNPIFRLLAISEMDRVIKNRTAAVALLGARVGESDPVILKALIEKLLQTGGPEAKAALGEIVKNAHTRGDDEIESLAKEAIRKSP
ncbi:hypothetical protein [Roseimicrobium sp. ORNL1]|uniref:hypothetical protein n=1 Tax=Roseimicrobium sp. ORNL1 TaxID=2711231 RepID=UPI0013E15F9D|nr:hypothetical protein [Roseimicrobium sp. ORNL1]QIF05571.1 hypothetical protein G5S37_30095 [Roseimicrobium sp. ORNL1]